MGAGRSPFCVPFPLLGHDMSNRPQQIVKDSTGTIHSYAPRLEQPVSVELKYRTPSESSTYDAYQAGTVDTLSETVLNDAAEGSTDVTMTAASSAEADVQYLIENVSETESPEPQVIESAGKSPSGVVVFLKKPTEAAIKASATLKGYRVSFQLPASSTESRGESLAHWKATFADGTVSEWSQQFFIVENESNPYSLTPSELLDIFPNIQHMKYRSTSMNELIDAGWLILRDDLLARGYHPQNVKSWSALTMVHANACYYHLVRIQENRDPIEEESQRQTYKMSFANLVEGNVQFWYDRDNTNAPRPEDHVPQTRGIGLTR